MKPCKAIRDLAATTDFSLFRSLELNEMLDAPRNAIFFFAARFGTTLPARPSVGQTLRFQHPFETNYVKKLVDIYQSKTQPSAPRANAVTAHQKYPDRTYSGNVKRSTRRGAETLRPRFGPPTARASCCKATCTRASLIRAGSRPRLGYGSTSCCSYPVRTARPRSSFTDLGVTHPKIDRASATQLANADRLTWVVNQVVSPLNSPSKWDSVSSCSLPKPSPLASISTAWLLDQWSPAQCGPWRP